MKRFYAASSDPGLQSPFGFLGIPFQSLRLGLVPLVWVALVFSGSTEIAAATEVLGPACRNGYALLENRSALATLLDHGELVPMRLRSVNRSRQAAFLDSGPLSLLAMSRGKEKTQLTYLTDQEGNLYLSDAKLPANPRPFWVLNTEGSTLLEPKEVGTISFDPHEKKWALEPVFSEPEELPQRNLLKDLRERIPKDSKIEAAPVNGLTKNRFLTCTQRATSSHSLPNYLGTAIGVDLSAQGGTMGLMGQFDTPMGRSSGIARLGWIVFMDSQTKTFDMVFIKKLRATKLSPALQFATVVATKVPLLKLDELMNKKWTDFVINSLNVPSANDGKSEAKKRMADATARATFEASLYKLSVSTGADYFLLNKLGPVTLKLCQMNPALTWIVNNQTVRIIERSALGAFTAWYVGRRTDTILKEVPESPAPSPPPSKKRSAGHAAAALFPRKNT